MPGVTGDFSRLNKVIRAVGEMSSPVFAQGLSRVLGAVALTQVQKGFRRSMDPYGRPWAPLKYRRGRPLMLTRRLRGSFAVEVTKGGGFAVRSDVDYGSYHQTGTRTIPARKMLPERSAGAGEWTEPMAKAAGRYMRRFVGR